MFRNFNVFGRSQLLLAIGRMCAVVRRWETAPAKTFKNITSFDFALRNQAENISLNVFRISSLPTHSG